MTDVRLTAVLFLCLQGLQFSVVASSNCSENCLPSPANDNKTCDLISGTCLHGCKPGYVGDQCALSCCHGCSECQLASESSSDVVCSKCRDGFFFDKGKCQECSTSCVRGCNQRNGKCIGGCLDGYYGDTCSKKCNAMCIDGQCDLTGSCVKGCVNPVLTGQNCSDFCSKGCKDRDCQQGGSCVAKGCNPGYWGRGCKNTCTECTVPADPTSDVCDEASGACLHGCKIGSRWGPQCKDECQSTCKLPDAASQTSRVCDEKTGQCYHGCKDSSHTWGADCTNPCELKCKRLDISRKVCTEDVGECIHGCEDDTHWGPMCDRPCAKTCLHETCQPENGACLLGCIDGYEGANCDIKDFCLLTQGQSITSLVFNGIQFLFIVGLSIVLCCCKGSLGMTHIPQTEGSVKNIYWK